jgi:hypothetical protein
MNKGHGAAAPWPLVDRDRRERQARVRMRIMKLS